MRRKKTVVGTHTMNQFNLESPNYTFKKVKDKYIVLFDQHNYALPVWGKVSSELKKQFNLVTFDYHTDTHGPFTAAFCKAFGEITGYSVKHPYIQEILEDKSYTQEEFSFEDVLYITENYVRHDEHILTAVLFGYIKAYHIIANISTGEVEYFQNFHREQGYDSYYYSKEKLAELSLDVELPLILDFDLDYFNRAEDFDEGFIELVRPLVKNATMITIAREQDYFESCKDEENFSVEEAEQKLLSIMEEILQ